jgi:hypothetical protein
VITATGVRAIRGSISRTAVAVSSSAAPLPPAAAAIGRSEKADAAVGAASVEWGNLMF